MSNKKPEALRLAEQLERFRSFPDDQAAAAELRRLHEVNQELLEALKDIAEWTERYTAPGHPIATVARAAIAKATGEQA